MTELERSLDLPTGQLHFLMYEGELWPALSVGEIEEGDYWRELARALNRDPAWVQDLLKNVWVPQAVDEEVVAIARTLRQRVGVALFSNATLRLEENLRALGLEGLFDPVINSARVGLRKPDPRAFDYALRLLGMPAHSVLFIDDKTRNTDVAEEMGIPSICFHTGQHLRDRLISLGLLPTSITA
jgi:putative hydrolase of the HAD superfamily